MTPVLRCSVGTKFDQIAPGGFRILAALDAACQAIEHDLTITAGTNDHEQGRHPLGEAYDVRTRDLTSAQILRLLRILTSTLGPAFTVLYERPTPEPDAALAAVAFINPHASGPHLHVQVKKGTWYPPQPTGVPV